MNTILKNFIAKRAKKPHLYAQAVMTCVLIAVEISAAALFFRVFPLLALLLSNFLTIALLVPLGWRCARLYGEALESKEGELQQSRAATLREQEEKRQLIADLQNQNEQLSAENQSLQNRLDTTLQIGTSPSSIHFVFKLETMEYLKQGYVVKKEALPPAEDPLIPLPFAPSEKEILYIHKYYYKVAIGIDFSAIKFCEQGNRFLFYGVTFAKLHDLTSECEPDESDINICEIRKLRRDRMKVVLDEKYDAQRNSYEKERAQEIKRQLDADVAEKCKLYTKVFRDNLKNRYANIDFVDDEEQASDKTLSSLNTSTNPRIVGIASTMLMLATVIQETRNIDNEQLSADTQLTV